MNNSIRKMAEQTVIKLVSPKAVPTGDIGGIFIGAQIITKAVDKAQSVRETIERYEELADTPLLAVSDFENGCGSMIGGLTVLPYLMSLGAANNEQLAYNYGMATALEARSVGANWSFSPVCDLNINPRNPLVNCRAISDDAALAARLLKQVIKGMQDGGLAACAKHFPGDGMDWRDQHIITTQNTLDKKAWLDTYGRVYTQLKDAYSVMVGHIALPKVCDDDMPGTLSHKIMSGLLKDELGFKGVVVTDALNMGGYYGYYADDQRNNIESFKAGADMLLWPSEGIADKIVEAVENSYIPFERLKDAYERVMAMKEKLGLFDGARIRTLSAADKELIEKTQRETAEKSITLIKDENKILPIKGKKTIAFVTVSHYEPSYEQARAAIPVLEKAGMSVEEFSDKAAVRQLVKRQNEFDYIVYALMTRPFRPQGPVDFMADEASKIWQIAKLDKNKTVVASFGSPYFVNQYFVRQHCYINAYSMLKPSVEAFARALIGEIPFTDFSPVKI